MALFRRNQLVVRRNDGTYEVRLDDDARAILTGLFEELAEAIEAGVDDPALHRLRPPAYPDDPERDQEYQLLAGEELRSSHQTAIDVAVAALRQDRLTEDDLWAWLRALNAIRLVVGTHLGISDDDEGPPSPRPDAPEEARRWAVYEFTTVIQYEIVRGLDAR